MGKMIVKIFPEIEPTVILFLGTESSLKDFLAKFTFETGLRRSRLIMEEVAAEDFKKELRIMREFSTGVISQHGDVP